MSLNNNELKTDEDFQTAFHEAVQCFPPPAGLEDAIEKHLGEIRASEAPVQVEKPAETKKDGKRKFVRIIKWATPSAAACLLIAILVFSLLPHPAVVPSAYAEIAEAVRNSQSAEWVRGVYANGQAEKWISLHPLRAILKDIRGVVIFDEADSCKLLRYEPDQNTIRILDSTMAMSDIEARQFNSVLDFILSAVENDKNCGAVLTKSQQTILGKECAVYHVQSPDGDRWKTLAVDSATRRVVRFAIREQGQEETTDFDYPGKGPEDIYALGVPRDAKIVDERTRDEQSNRMCVSANEAERRFHKNLRAVVTVGPYDPKSKKAAVRDISVYCQTLHQRRVDHWSISDAAQPSNLDRIEGLETYLQSHSPDYVNITAPGGGSVSYNLTHPQEVRRSTIKSGEPALFENLLWQTSPDHFGRAVPDKTTPNGTLPGTRRINPAVICQNVSGQEVGYLPVRWTVYVNPDRDYIAERSEEWIGSLMESWVPQSEKEKTFPPVNEYVRGPSKTKTTVLEYAQTSSGKWYPRKQLIEGDLHGKPGTYLRVIHLDTTYQFPEGLFSAEVFEKQLNKPVKQY